MSIFGENVESLPLIPLDGDSNENAGLIPLNPPNLEGDLLPITDMDSLGSTSSTNEQPTSTGIAQYIVKLAEKKGLALEEGVEIKDDEDSVLSFLEEISIADAENKLQEYLDTKLEPLNKKFVELVESGVSEAEAASIIVDLKTIQSTDKDALKMDEELAEKFYKTYLKNTTNYSDAKIAKEIEKKKDLGVLTDDAYEVYDELLPIIEEKEKAAIKAVEEAELEQQNKLKEKAQKLQTYIKEVKEIAGIELNDKMREAWMKEFNLVDVGGNRVNPILATRMKDPDKFDALLRFYNSLGLFKYDETKKDFVPDLTVLKAPVKKQVTKEVEAAVDNEKLRSLRATGGVGTTKDVTKEELLERLKKVAQSQK